METYNSKMNRPAFFEPTGSYMKGFTWRLWNTEPGTFDKQLYEAAFKNDLNEVEAALRRGANPSAADDGGWTALHSAAGWGNVKMMDLLVSRHGGANVNAQNKKGETPLHTASYGGHIEAVRWLLEMGDADATIRDEQGWTAAHWALEHENDVLREMFEHLTTNE